MKKYLALALVSSLVMGNASASQTLNALDAANPVLANGDEQKIGEFEVGLQFFMTPSATKLKMAATGKQYDNTGTADEAPAITDKEVVRVPNTAFSDKESKMYGFGMNVGWNGLQSKIGTSGLLLGSIGGIVSYSRFDSGVAGGDINDAKFERFILGARASVAPLFCTGKDIKVGPYVTGVLGGAQTHFTFSQFGTPALGDFKKGTTGTFSNNVWSDVDVNTVGVAGTVTPSSSEMKFGKIFSTDFDAWKLYYAGEVGVRFQMRNVGLQLGASFDNNEYKITSFQDKSKTFITGKVYGDSQTFSDFYAVGSTTAESVTGTKVETGTAKEFNEITFKKGDSSINTSLTASIILDM